MVWRAVHLVADRPEQAVPIANLRVYSQPVPYQGFSVMALGTQAHR